jgi:tRNA (cmo5U34)-methyltransferase
MEKHDQIEREVLSVTDEWVFDDKVSAIFDTHVRRSIPCYDEIQELVSSVSVDILGNGSVVYDLGTATGEVICNISRKNPDKAVSYFGIDNSASMIREAARKCQSAGRVILTCCNVEDYDFTEPADMVISAFTLQFLEPSRRVPVLLRIRKTLKEHGVFILCEKVVPADPEINSRYVGYHERWKSRYFSRDEIRVKKERLVNVMKPLSAEANVEQLTEAGFRKVIPLFQWCNFLCWIAH